MLVLLQTQTFHLLFILNMVEIIAQTSSVISGNVAEWSYSWYIFWTVSQCVRINYLTSHYCQ